jgi:alkanesulfonate monooxygenase SsuD/methylene tetrahydromethanopterin reductase-like flavin-dependent oxidoreductase (luciferase family)
VLTIGILLPTAVEEHRGAGARDVVDLAVESEAAGFDGVYVGDHILHPRPLLESVVTLSFVAAATERVSIGPCVMLVALRHPVVLAKQLATLDQLSAGRLRLGIGVGGEYPDEWTACDSPIEQRGATTDNSVRTVRALLDGDPAGALGPITPAAAHRVPFLFAGRRPAALRRAARLGDGWIGYLISPSGLARARQALLAERAHLGLEGQAFRTGILLPVRIDARDDGARGRASAIWSGVTANGVTFPDKLFAAGRPETVLEHIQAYVDQGCDELVLALADTPEETGRQFGRLAAEVLPALRRLPAAVQGETGATAGAPPWPPGGHRSRRSRSPAR